MPFGSLTHRPSWKSLAVQDGDQRWTSLHLVWLVPWVDTPKIMLMHARSPVDSVNVTARPESPHHNETTDFSVEIMLDETVVHVIRVIEGGDSLSWREEIPMCV